MAYKVIRNCSDGVIGNLYRPGDIIEDHPQLKKLLEKGTVIPYEPEPEVEAVEDAKVKGSGKAKTEKFHGEPDPLKGE